MANITALRALKDRLPRTWDAFFGRHGSFTAAQVAAIPALLDGANIILSAPTASGKTEAVLAPLIEKHCQPIRAKIDRQSLTILFLTPTRALANDLYKRLETPCERLRVSLAIKTRDFNTFRPNYPAQLLITTPESTDSLLTGHARLFIDVRAVVIDELHLFDGTPRGDQLRVVLRRIQHIRTYAAAHGDAPDSLMQYAALSASLAQPEASAARYFAAPRAVIVSGQRPIVTDLIALTADHDGDDAHTVRAYLQTFRARGWKKALCFCNSRAEVESYAASVRGRSLFHDDVYTHYSNIEAQRRREIEDAFSNADAAICFASSTLELGIDIGSIDVVLLIGPPGSLASYLQRIGRGSRRSQTTHAACFWRNPFERIVFETLESQSRHLIGSADSPNSAAAFRPAVAIQQIFSLIKQSKTGAVRLPELIRLFDGLLSAESISLIVGQLEQMDYLKVGRPGEWRSGQCLNDLIAQQANLHSPLSLYSNIAINERRIEIRDLHTQRPIASVQPHWFDRDVLTLEGKPLSIEWADGEAVWVKAYKSNEPAPRTVDHSARQVLSFELAQAIAAHGGLAVGDAPYVSNAVNNTSGGYWFHWLGDLYSTVLFDLLRPHMAIDKTDLSGICFYAVSAMSDLPKFSADQIQEYLNKHYHRFESMLALGAFYHLLPSHLQAETVLEQFDVARFQCALAAMRLYSVSDSAPSMLYELCAMLT